MMFEDITSDEIRGRIDACHMDVRAMYDYWLAKRGGRAMPARADLEPVEIKKLLPMLVLVDVTADARRFVYRLERIPIIWNTQRWRSSLRIRWARTS
jgi:hypothetical protein